MRRFIQRLLFATSVIGCAACGGSSGDACERWKDAALRYASCNPALVLWPTVTQECVSDQEVARRGPLRTLAACADNLAGLTYDCRGLEVLREAYRSGDDTVVFDYAQKTGVRPGCDCDPLDTRFRTPPTQSETEGQYQCAALVVQPEAGMSD
jgi:hypothetical protein